MRTLLPFTLLLVALSAFGQPAPINRHAMAISGLATTPASPLPPNLTYRWRGSSPTNSPVTNWVDEVHGVVASVAAANAPTWSTDHLVFSGNEWLQISPSVLVKTAGIGGAGDSVVVLVASHGVFASGVGVWMGGSTSSGTESQYFNALGGTYTLRFALTQMGAIAVNNVCDMLYNGSENLVYTNNISTTQGGPGPTNLVSFGKNIPGNFGKLVGSIYDVLIWTNASFNASQRASIHQYLTNLYPSISP